MDLIQILSFAAVATVLVISPGPNGVLIAKTVPASGKQAGFANIAGFVGAFGVHGSLSILGVSFLLVQSSQAFFIFKILGAAYLCWIGLKSIISAWKSVPENPKRHIQQKPSSLYGAFFEGFFTNVLNPKVSMFYLAAFPQFIPLGGNELSAAMALVCLHALINVLWFSAMILLLARIKQFSKNSALSRWLKSATGAVMIGFGARLASLSPANNT